MRHQLVWLAVPGSVAVGYALLCCLTGFGDAAVGRRPSDGQRTKLAGLLAEQQKERSIREKLEAANDGARATHALGFGEERRR